VGNASRESLKNQENQVEYLHSFGDSLIILARKRSGKTL